jgi:hypothetical protein
VIDLAWYLYAGGLPTGIQGGQTYVREVQVAIEDLPAACKTIASGTHDADDDPSGPGCTWPDTISVTWS